MDGSGSAGTGRLPDASESTRRLPRGRRDLRDAAILFGIAGVMLGGCDPFSLTVLGVGTSAGVQHTLNGISYKTFALPLPEVRSATLSSLDRMGIRVASKEKTADGELIKASAREREVEVQLDAITPRTTRMRTVVRDGWFMDSATGTEIIIQTERALNNGKGANS